MTGIIIIIEPRCDIIFLLNIPAKIYNFHLLLCMKSVRLLVGWVGTVLSLFASNSGKREKIKLLSKLDVVLSFKQCIFTVKKLTMISIYTAIYNKNILYEHVLSRPDFGFLTIWRIMEILEAYKKYREFLPPAY